MTREVRIDLTTSTPKVYINGLRTECSINMTYHKRGGLNIVGLHLRQVPEEASMVEVEEGMGLETSPDYEGLGLFVCLSVVVCIIAVLALAAIRLL